MSTQASPGLNAPGAYQPLPGIPPNMSAIAAQSAGLLPANVQITNPQVGLGLARSLLGSHCDAGTHGTQNGASIGALAENGGSGLGPTNSDNGNGPGSANLIVTSTPASNIQTSNPPGFQG